LEEPDTSGLDTQQHARFPSSDSFDNTSRKNYYPWNSANSLLGTAMVSYVERSWYEEVKMLPGRVG